MIIPAMSRGKVAKWSNDDATNSFSPCSQAGVQHKGCLAPLRECDAERRGSDQKRIWKRDVGTGTPRGVEFQGAAPPLVPLRVCRATAGATALLGQAHCKVQGSAMIHTAARLTTARIRTRRRDPRQGLGLIHAVGDYSGFVSVIEQS